jgi:L-cysteine:1D-myo-inositol 2-amino-2-deoxy-alpha-D-glucopyranoside ligase
MMRLYDTGRGEVVDFEPGPTVTMYVCGITPYDTTHVGHAATYVTYDVVQRRLIDLGHEVRYVRNITDVDDDMLRASAMRGVHYLDLAFGETARFDEDMAALNCLEPWSEPRASGAISNIRGLIDTLLTRGAAYQVDRTVFFDTSTPADFGALAGVGLDRMHEILGAWGEEPDDPRKRNPLDFVLWRPADPGEPSWGARWGTGRPGWHVECSAIALRELGPTIDLHGGGIDLLYPHHESVRVQCEAATGTTFVRHWLHQSMVHLDGRKMSKSDGNLIFVRDLRERFEPAAIRLALSIHRYRRPWNWTDALLVEAEERLTRWRWAGAGDAALDAVRAALDDDLDVPTAIDAIDRAAAQGEGVDQAASLIGVQL